MAITLFQPKVWSATLLSVLAKSLVYAGPQCVNRNYEGEIASYGDSVQITAIDDPSISDYTKDTDLGDVEALTDTDQVLTIDQAKSFNFQVDNIDMRQSRNGGALMTEAAFRAGFKLRDTADQYVAGLMAVGAQTDNNLGTISVSATATDAYDKVLVPLSTVLDEANVPEEGRYVVVPPAFYAKLLLDSRFIKVNESGSQMGLRNGNVGNALGFTVSKSNNAPTAVRSVTDGVTTSGSKSITSATAKFSASDVGAAITGTGIAASTTVASVQSATAATLSANATATGTAITFAIGTTGSKLIIAGSNIATTYAEQINKVQAYQPEKRFADALKGLHLYGAKVIRPEAIASASVLTS